MILNLPSQHPLLHPQEQEEIRQQWFIQSGVFINDGERISCFYCSFVQYVLDLRANSVGVTIVVGLPNGNWFESP